MNRRLNEIQLALSINHMDKGLNKKDFKDFMNIILCYCKVLDKDSIKTLVEVMEKSVCDNCLGASDKEKIAVLNELYSKTKAAEKLGKTYTSYYLKYKEYIYRDDVNGEYLESIQPVITENPKQFHIREINRFIENFKFPLGEQEHDLQDNNRTLEIEFWLLFNKLMSILGNAYAVTRFFNLICYKFDIGASDIIKLCQNIDYLNRSYPKRQLGQKYFRQELYTLYKTKGVTNRQISLKVLGYSTNIYNMSSSKDYKTMLTEDKSWQYTAVLDWDYINKDNVKAVIELLHRFIRYDI